jgi:predicted transcriptional regulator
MPMYIKDRPISAQEKNMLEKVFNLLGLSKNEQIIFSLFKSSNSGHTCHTPWTLEKQCDIPRASIYTTLQKLENRGMIYRIHDSMGSKIIWMRMTDEILESFIAYLRDYLVPNDNYVEW